MIVNYLCRKNSLGGFPPHKNDAVRFGSKYDQHWSGSIGIHTQLSFAVGSKIGGLGHASCFCLIMSKAYSPFAQPVPCCSFLQFYPKKYLCFDMMLLCTIFLFQ